MNTDPQTDLLELARACHLENYNRGEFPTATMIDMLVAEVARLRAVPAPVAEGLSMHMVQQLSAVLASAGAPEFDNAGHAAEWAASVKAAMENRAPVAEGDVLRGSTDHLCGQQSTQITFTKRVLSPPSWWRDPVVILAASTFDALNRAPVAPSYNVEGLKEDLRLAQKRAAENDNALGQLHALLFGPSEPWHSWQRVYQEVARRIAPSDYLPKEEPPYHGSQTHAAVNEPSADTFDPIAWLELLASKWPGGHGLKSDYEKCAALLRKQARELGQLRDAYDIARESFAAEKSRADRAEANYKRMDKLNCTWAETADKECARATAAEAKLAAAVLTLRDGLAASAMNAYVSGENPTQLQHNPLTYAVESYVMADAMLEARKPQPATKEGTPV